MLCLLTFRNLEHKKSVRVYYWVPNKCPHQHYQLFNIVGSKICITVLHPNFVRNKMGGTHSLPCNIVAREIWLWAKERNIWLSVNHIAGSANL